MEVRNWDGLDVARARRKRKGNPSKRQLALVARPPTENRRVKLHASLFEKSLVAEATLANFIMMFNVMSGIVRHAEAAELVRSWLGSLDNDSFDDCNDSVETGFNRQLIE